MITKALLAAAAFALVAAGLQVPMRAWAVGSASHAIPPEALAKPLTPAEVRNIESYMRQIFGNAGIRIVHTAPDAEVFLGEHFLGVVYPDDQPGGRTYYFEMAIFEEETVRFPPPIRGR